MMLTSDQILNDFLGSSMFGLSPVFNTFSWGLPAQWISFDWAGLKKQMKSCPLRDKGMTNKPEIDSNPPGYSIFGNVRLMSVEN
jgi:hypothetical protein